MSVSNLKLSFFLLLLSVGFAASARADIVPDNGCFVISGTKHDGNGALSQLTAVERGHQKLRFGAYQCTIFNSYGELKTYLKTSGLSAGAPIMVLQIAHGAPGGSAALNGVPGSGLRYAEDLLKDYNDLASIYRVALINQSCYSGDMLEALIAWQSHNAKSKTIDNLCMTTAALPGRVSVDVVAQMDISPFHQVFNIEDAYLAHPVGLITSAAWGEVHMTDYTEPKSQLPTYPLYKTQHPEVFTKLAVDATTFMDGVSNMLHRDSSALSPLIRSYVQNAEIAMSSATTGTKIRAYENAKRTASISDMDHTAVRGAFFQGTHGDDACANDLRTYAASEWYKVFAQATGAPWPVFAERLMSEAKTALPNCADTPKTQDIVEWANWLSVRSTLGQYLLKYGKAQAAFDDAFGVNSTDYDGAFRTLIASANQSMNQSNNLTAFLSGIGVDVDRGEMQNMPIAPGVSEVVAVPTLGAMGATGNILPAFTAMSLVQSNAMNPVDSRRRNACRSIELKIH